MCAGTAKRAQPIHRHQAAEREDLLLEVDDDKSGFGGGGCSEEAAPAAHGVARRHKVPICFHAARLPHHLGRQQASMGPVRRHR